MGKEVMKFTFDDKMIDIALRVNGWSDLWHPDNWVHYSSKNPDYAGVSKKKAFETLLYDSNLVGDGRSSPLDECWSEE